MLNKPTYEELERRIWELEQSNHNQHPRVEKGIPSQNLMDYIISHARSAIMVFDRDFKYIYVSRRYLTDYKIKEENVIGKYHYEVFPDIPEKWKEVHQRSLAGEVLSSEEDPFYRSDGSIEWTRWECRPWYESDGSIGGIVIYNEIINERMKMEEKLRRSENLLSTHLLNTPVGAVSWDLEFKAIEWNPAAALIFGYTREEAMGQHITKLILPEDAKKLVNGVFQDLFAGTGGERSVNKNITKSGRRILCDWYNTVLKNPAGDIIGMASLVNDITDRKRSEDINKTLFAISNAVNTTLSLNDLYAQIHSLLGKIIDVTNFFIAIVSEKKHTLFFPYYVDTVDDDYSPITNFEPKDSLTGLVVSSRKPVLLKKEKLKELADKDGVWGTVPLIWVGVPLIVKDEIIGVIVVQSYTDPHLYDEEDLKVLISISDQMAVAIDRKRTEDELRKSEEKFRTAFKTSPYVIAITSIEDGSFVEINDTFTKLLGYSQKETIGQSSLVLNVWNDSKDRDRLVSKLKKNGLVENFEAAFKGKNGQIVNGLMSARTLEIGDKHYLLAVTQDITELKDNEKKRLDLESRLQQAQKMESIGTLAGGIAHDFNNILSGMFGYSQLAQTHINNPEKANNYIDQTLKGAKRAAQLVQQILTFSRQTEYQKGALRIYQQVNEALKLLRSTIPSTIEIKKELDSRSTILADPVKIHQVIMNLCTNAYHAMRETGGRLKVSLMDVVISEPKQLNNKNIPPGDYLKLEVSDTGHGMEEKIMEKAFDPYYTTNETGEGTGLGLAIVQAIVDEHEGFLEVFSTPGEGTHFYIYFPIVIEKVTPHDLKSKERPSLAGNERIMFIDDEAPIREIAKALLERYGYDIRLFENGIEAQNEFEKCPDQFDLIITDMNMPGMAGDELSVKLKKKRSDIPIIICTGFSDVMTSEKAASMGIDGFLMKPIVMKALTQKIREVLDKNLA